MHQPSFEQAVARYARDLYLAAIVEEVRTAALEKRRIDSRHYERVYFNCVESAYQMFKMENPQLEIPEGELNVIWDKITSKLRGK